MRYFEKNYDEIRYPIERGTQAGLRKSQIGAIHAIASHFTIKDDPAIIVMPTGSGKTAVLMMSAFVERARRVCVITPSRMVRSQICEDFKQLNVLKSLGVLTPDIPCPRVTEVEGLITSESGWKKLKHYDVVIGTPFSISPAIEGVAKPPKGMFDLLLIDEAHHSPARTWNSIIESFPAAKKILFTATPFRNDRREIKGRFVYTYHIRDAVKDGIFAQVKNIKVVQKKHHISSDHAIAKRAEKIFEGDRKRGYNHYLMVRTDTIKRAKELKNIYDECTHLKLCPIHSELSFSDIRNKIRQLKQNEYQGIICVDMLGEGFDFPCLKIAAIHTPHKSLGVTLQFIGRCARTSGTKKVFGNLGEAKFIAVPSEIEGEVGELYKDGTIWLTKINDISEKRITLEGEEKKFFASIKTPAEGIFRDISLYSLRTYRHVKVYKVDKGEVNLNKTVCFPGRAKVIFTQSLGNITARVLITQEKQKLSWTDEPDAVRFEYNLFIVYYHASSRLLFINASEKNEQIYETLAKQLCSGTTRNLESHEINQVLNGLNEPHFFNIGVKKNIACHNNNEVYRIHAGANAQDAISKVESNTFELAHVFGKSNGSGEKMTIGCCSGSKIWSNKTCRIPELLEWCDQLANKIKHDRRKIRTGTKLDQLKPISS